MNSAFMNGTVTGKDVWIPMESILGGPPRSTRTRTRTRTPDPNPNPNPNPSLTLTLALALALALTPTLTLSRPVALRLRVAHVRRVPRGGPGRLAACGRDANQS